MSESKEVDPKPTAEATKELLTEAVTGERASGDDEPGTAAEQAAATKKKSKKAKLKKALGMEAGSGASKPASKLTPSMIEQLLEMNPSLKNEVAGMDHDKVMDALQKLNISDLMTGMSVSGSNQKDMASYKFWQTQPVPRFDDKADLEEGPIKQIDPDKVPKEPRALYEGFEWVTMDLEAEKELTEVHELLTDHYVEDPEAMFRLNYAASFLNWALKAPGWRKDWHVGVRATKSQKLVAFISAIPISLRVQDKVLTASEVNFLCVHKKLRSKRLAPVLIEEITRRCYVHGTFQAIYSGGTVLPKPISSCRYFHRPLEWKKLYEVGFSGLPNNSTVPRQVARNHVPSTTAIPGLRYMEKKDVKAVHDLLHRFLKRFQFAPEFTEEEIEHWIVHDPKSKEQQVVWSWVVEDPKTHKITDFTSFYLLESLIIKVGKHKTIRAAYSFYYASEAAFSPEEKGFKDRLNALTLDTLVLAKELNFDVVNALSLLDNPLFLDQQKFGAGDGQLHYYLYNYRTPAIPGGVDEKNRPDESKRGGIGVVML